jgi:hypothetical protein
MAISPKRTSGQLPEPASGVGRCSTSDESHADNCRFARHLPAIRCGFKTLLVVYLRINVLDFPSNSAAMSAAYSHFLVGVPLRSACRHASRL